MNGDRRRRIANECEMLLTRRETLELPSFLPGISLVFAYAPQK
jgi:hypothetical protein